MRLLFLSSEFPNAADPTKATFNYDLLSALSADHAVTVVSPVSWWDEVRAKNSRPAADWPRVRQIGDLTVHYPRYYYTPGVLRHHYGRYLWWSLRATVSEILRNPRPDCILSYWAHPDGEAAIRLARLLRVPCAVMVGGSDVLLLTRDARRRRCVARVLRQADAVLAVSSHLRDRVIQLGTDPRRVHLLRRGVNEAIFRPGDRHAARRRLGLPTDRPLMLWAGRFVSVKGLDILLQACEMLRRQRPDFQLYLIGDGPLRAALVTEVQQRDLGAFVQFVGSVPHDRLGLWFQAADLTVLPSRSEGTPNVLLESLSCGTPFVASDVGGIREIPSSSAILVPAEHPTALATALDAALRAPRSVSRWERPQTIAESAGQLTSLLKNVLAAVSEERVPPVQEVVGTCVSSFHPV